MRGQKAIEVYRLISSKVKLWLLIRSATRPNYSESSGGGNQDYHARKRYRPTIVNLICPPSVKSAMKVHNCTCHHQSPHLGNGLRLTDREAETIFDNYIKLNAVC